MAPALEPEQQQPEQRPAMEPGPELQTMEREPVPEPEPQPEPELQTVCSAPRRVDPRELERPSRNEHREEEVKAWIVEAQRLEDSGQMMEAMELWRKSFKVCPQLEEASYISHDRGASWQKT
eukprot:COSAG04_NODE_7101_length_1191_cov_2.307692_1_plen_122_part_00